MTDRTVTDSPGQSASSWHTLPWRLVARQLQTGAEGLTETEARERLARHGPNRLAPREEAVRTMTVNAVVAAEMFYLLNSRFILAPVLTLDGLTGNRYILLAIAACIPLQFATHAPGMREIRQARAARLQMSVAGQLVASA
ncbi:hypothetical protein LMG23992_00678 [Cupriavidus laharis]|uniref:Cation-transporting P-type ATPase N-terminal domain-containing protein n=1 Tax=Cupriavidus laharis TaxID=151654 RepID=A0ABM8WFF3_9BURK|nr:cation-transporting P-type ATPase [Cupriavidus laharis]CAG9166063.1 hypothetical protein LMG23992_00678 [Cupriavidus laharis]